MKRRPTPRRGWQPLEPAVASDPSRYEQHGLSAPDEVWRNDRYSVFVRYLGDGTDPDNAKRVGRRGAMHLSLHRHDREAVRDWRHFQAIKNEIAGPERTAVEVFPPESQLVDAANEYHLWVMPVGMPLPFLMPVKNVMTHEQGVERYGLSRARQRPWERGIPTGLGCEGH